MVALQTYQQFLEYACVFDIIQAIRNLNPDIPEKFLQDLTYKLIKNYSKAKLDYIYTREKLIELSQDISQSGRVRTEALKHLADTITREANLEVDLATALKQWLEVAVKDKDRQNPPVRVEVKADL